jgi:hypothetical protein
MVGHQPLNFSDLRSEMLRLLSQALQRRSPEPVKSGVETRSQPAESISNTDGSPGNHRQINSCSSCGHPNPASQKFCGECGARLSSDMISQVAASTVPRSTEPKPLRPENAGPQNLSIPPSPKTAQPERPRPIPNKFAQRGISVRQWFRMSRGINYMFTRVEGGIGVRFLASPWSTNTTSVATKHAEDIARALAFVRDKKLVSEQEFRRLHVALRFIGPSPDNDPGSLPLWTVGLKSLTWSRLEGGQWVPAGPPPGKYPVLELDTELLKAIISNSSEPGAGVIAVALNAPAPQETKPRNPIEQAQEHAEPKKLLTWRGQ